MRILYCLLFFVLFSLSVSAADVIIVPDSLYSSALELKQLRSEHSISSDIVNISFIASHYSSDFSIPLDGSDSRFFPYVYDSGLAKKMISFISSNSYTSVTLFGSSFFIPPSYYVYDAGGVDIVDSWIPADSFYSKDFSIPVGRIPVRSKADADVYLQKLRDWYSYAGMGSVALAGSDPSSDFRYYGELIADVFADELAGRDFDKLYLSSGRFTVDALKDVLQSGDSGLLYIVGHGSMDSLQLDSALTSGDIFSLSTGRQFQPVVFSSLCSNGAFDSSVISQPLSIGESMIISGAGSVSFLGSSRLSYGLPVLSYSGGVVAVEESRYMSELMELMIRSYKSGYSDIGSITKDAVSDFVSANGLSDPLNRRTLYEFVLLGDPTLKLPAYQIESSYAKPVLSVSGSPDIELADGESVTVFVSGVQPSTLLRVLRDNVIVGSAVGSASYTFTPVISGTYLVIAENPDGKGSRMFLNITAGVIKDIFSLDVPSNIIFDQSGRGVHVSKDISVTNDGNKFMDIDVVSSSGINISQSFFSLAVNESISLSLSAFIPDYADSGIDVLGYVRFNSSGYSVSVPVISDVLPGIAVSDVSVYVDGKKRSADVVGVKPGSSLKVSVEIENLMPDVDIDSAVVDVNISGIVYDPGDDGFDDLEDSSRSFSVRSLRSGKGVVELAIPKSVNKGVYLVYVAVRALDDNGAGHSLSYSFSVEVDKEKYDLEISRLEFDHDVVPCDSFAELYITVENFGEEDSYVILSVFSSKLGLDLSKEIFLDSRIDSDENRYSKTVEISSSGLDPGSYPVSVYLERGSSLEDSKEVMLYVDACPVVEEDVKLSVSEIEAMHNIEQLNRQVYSQKSSFKDSSAYRMLISVVVVLWIGFIVFVLGAVIILAGRR